MSQLPTFLSGPGQISVPDVTVDAGASSGGGSLGGISRGLKRIGEDILANETRQERIRLAEEREMQSKAAAELNRLRILQETAERARRRDEIVARASVEISQASVDAMQIDDASAIVPTFMEHAKAIAQSTMKGLDSDPILREKVQGDIASSVASAQSKLIRESALASADRAIAAQRARDTIIIQQVGDKTTAEIQQIMSEREEARSDLVGSAYTRDSERSETLKFNRALLRNYAEAINAVDPQRAIDFLESDIARPLTQVTIRSMKEDFAKRNLEQMRIQVDTVLSRSHQRVQILSQTDPEAIPVFISEQAERIASMPGAQLPGVFAKEGQARPEDIQMILVGRNLQAIASMESPDKRLFDAFAQALPNTPKAKELEHRQRQIMNRNRGVQSKRDAAVNELDSAAESARQGIEFPGKPSNTQQDLNAWYDRQRGSGRDRSLEDIASDIRLMDRVVPSKMKSDIAGLFGGGPNQDIAAGARVLHAFGKQKGRLISLDLGPVARAAYEASVGLPPSEVESAVAHLNAPGASAAIASVSGILSAKTTDGIRKINQKIVDHISRQTTGVPGPFQGFAEAFTLGRRQRIDYLNSDKQSRFRGLFLSEAVRAQVVNRESDPSAIESIAFDEASRKLIDGHHIDASGRDDNRTLVPDYVPLELGKHVRKLYQKRSFFEDGPAVRKDIAFQNNGLVFIPVYRDGGLDSFMQWNPLTNKAFKVSRESNLFPDLLSVHNGSVDPADMTSKPELSYHREYKDQDGIDLAVDQVPDQMNRFLRESLIQLRLQDISPSQLSREQREAVVGFAKELSRRHGWRFFESKERDQ